MAESTGASSTLLRDIFICAAIHVVFIGTGIETGIYDMLGMEHAHGGEDLLADNTGHEGHGHPPGEHTQPKAKAMGMQHLKPIMQ